MKNLFILFIVSFLFLSCGKEEIKEVEIIKACQNVAFLKVETDYYRICNVKDVESLENGVMLRLAYKELDECKEKVSICDATVMLPESKSWVKVLYQL